MKEKREKEGEKMGEGEREQQSCCQKDVIGKVKRIKLFILIDSTFQ